MPRAELMRGFPQFGSLRHTLASRDHSRDDDSSDCDSEELTREMKYGAGEGFTCFQSERIFQSDRAQYSRVRLSGGVPLTRVRLDERQMATPDLSPACPLLGIRGGVLSSEVYGL